MTQQSNSSDECGQTDAKPVWFWECVSACLDGAGCFFMSKVSAFTDAAHFSEQSRGPEMERLTDYSLFYSSQRKSRDKLIMTIKCKFIKMQQVLVIVVVT